MGQHLLVLSLGPVQDFIASARRFRDLWYGSWLLANLAREAAKALHQHEAKLLFPAAKPEDLKKEDFSPANKILAVVGHPEAAAKAAQDAAQAFLNQQLAQVFAELKGLGPDVTLDEATAKAQVQEWLEMPWAAVPLEGNYAQARNQAEALLAARKNTRNFTAVSWNAGLVGQRPKSSLDGQREAVLLLGNSWDQKPEALTRWGLRPSEKLCGLGLLKRFGEKNSADSKVPSTSHMAALGSLSKAKDPARLAEAMDHYLSELEHIAGGELSRARKGGQVQGGLGRLNGAALYVERLEELGLSKKQLPEAQKALKEALKASGLGQPSPYYALLLGDGDRMGQAIAHQESIEGHQGLSRALEDFAQEARGIVKKHGGTTVYAGGDDVMAMLPLHQALAASRALADKFKDKLARYAGKEGSPTLSVGLAVVHHLEPLSEALNTLRQAEAHAKNSGRNALCLAVDKRSGSVSMVAGSWDNMKGLDGQLKEAAGLLASGALPDGAAYELRQLATDLEGWKDESKRNAAATAEAKRILRRKRTQDQESVGAELQKQVVDWMTEDHAGVKRTADLLVNARIFADVLPKTTASAAGMGE